MDVGLGGPIPAAEDPTAGVEVQFSSVQGIKNALAAKLPELPVDVRGSSVAVKWALGRILARIRELYPPDVHPWYPAHRPQSEFLPNEASEAPPGGRRNCFTSRKVLSGSPAW